MREWNDLFVAAAGAAAALSGLLFVGVSINLVRILSIKSLPERALVSILLLLSILLFSLIFLVPDQSFRALGIETFCIAFFLWVVILRLHIRTMKFVEQKYRRHFIFTVVTGQLASLSYIAAAIVLLTAGADGLYWIVGAFLFSLIKSIGDSWVLLVEINR